MAKQKITKLTIDQMTTMEELEEASEYELFPVYDLIARAEEVADTEEELETFTALCNGYEKPIHANAWTQRPPTVR